jgi:hypothetical protein
MRDDIMVPPFPEEDFGYDDRDEGPCYFIVRGSVARESGSRASSGATPESDLHWGTLTAQPGPGKDPWRGHDRITISAPMRRWRLPFPPLFRDVDAERRELWEWPRPPTPKSEPPAEFDSESVADAYLALRWRHYLMWRVGRSGRRRIRIRKPNT